MEKKRRKNKQICPYCGDAPTNHKFLYFSGLFSVFLDPLFMKMTRLIPTFFVSGAEYLLTFFFNISCFLKFIKFSDDIEKSVTLRSKIIWEEAKRRKIEMEQVVVFGKYTDNFRARLKGKDIYFNSLPIIANFYRPDEKWDDKFFIKKAFQGESIPIPLYEVVPFSKQKRKFIFEKFSKPIIVKPRVGSRGRHTTTNIYTFSDFQKAYKLATMIYPQAIMEEHLSGYVCRATCVDGKLVGFYRAEPASIIGDGKKKIIELIEEKNKNKLERVENVKIGEELISFIKRKGYDIFDVLPLNTKIDLSHRIGRLFGGITKEMLDELHPSFFPVLEKVGRITNLPVVGIDCIIPNPEDEEKNQNWGIIECNTLPFIDLHYFALEGKPKNIAGMIWDLCAKSI
ncbi:MAG: hypothetical protein WCX79_03270 [Candidatus Paceibacterota bacterium]